MAVGEAARIGSLPRVGDRVDRYEVIAEIAHGGMAAVYAVRRSSIGGFDKVMAMKVLLPHLQTDAQFVDMFLDEARIASLMQHPNIVHAFDLGEHEGQPFMVMELLKGQSLNRVLRKAKQLKKPLPLGFYCRVLAETAAGLHAAHETKGTDGEHLHIVHRDVSPQNIHIGYDGLVKVVDFGIASARGRIAGTKTGELKGKLTYMAPEQVDRQQPINRKVDVWALGVVAWELLAGRRLFKADEDATRLWMIMNMEIPDLREVAPRIPPELSRLVMACLDRRQDGRPESCLELSETFDAIARELKHGSSSTITEVMLDLFATERAVEEDRLQAALRGGPPGPLLDGEPGSGVTSSPSVSGIEMIAPEADAVGPDRGRRNLVLAGVAAVVVLAGTGAMIALAGGDGASDDAPAPVAEAPAEPERTTVTIHVPTEARMVLVNGERRDGSPLRLRLASDETADIELVSPTGDIVRQTVRASDDGRHLELPAAATPVVAETNETEPTGEATEAPAEPEPAAATPSGNRTTRRSTRRALLGNPYE